jgi:hypothetical protein
VPEGRFGSEDQQEEQKEELRDPARRGPGGKEGDGDVSLYRLLLGAKVGVEEGAAVEVDRTAAEATRCPRADLGVCEGIWSDLRARMRDVERAEGEQVIAEDGQLLDEERSSKLSAVCPKRARPSSGRCGPLRVGRVARPRGGRSGAT